MVRYVRADAYRGAVEASQRLVKAANRIIAARRPGRWATEEEWAELDAAADALGALTDGGQ
jgi:hypothetical protein